MRGSFRTKEEGAMRRLASVVGVAIALLGLEGCLTTGVYTAWVDSPQHSTLDLGARRPDSSKLEILWRERSSGGFSSSGVLSLEPGLDGCGAIEVMGPNAGGLHLYLLAEREERIFLGSPQAGSPGRAWGEFPDPECRVLLAVESPGPSDPFHTLHASTREGDLGTVRIPARRNPLWLALLPPAAVVDVATVPIWGCLFACPLLLNGVQIQP